MRVLVTGATGFVGSHVVRRLATEPGCQVAALVRPASLGRWEVDAPAGVSPIVGDCASIGEAAGAFRDFAPDAIVHAAWKGVTAAERDSAAQAENIGETLDLVRVAADAGCRTFLGLGSQAEYGRVEGVISEDVHPRPTTWYGLAKLTTSMLAARLAADLDVRFLWLRLFSAYGPGDHPDAMIPSLVRSLLVGETMPLTPGLHRWDYVQINDAAAAIALALRTPSASGVFNLGSGTAVEIRRVAEAIRDLIDPDLPLGLGDRPYPASQVMHLEADISRLRRLTGWSPLTPLDAGLAGLIPFASRRRPVRVEVSSNLDGSR